MIRKIIKCVLLLFLISLTISWSMAQDDAKFEFNGKVGGLSNLNQDFESTIMIELNIAYSLSKHVAISGGAAFCNYAGPSEILVGGEDFLEYLNTFAPLRIQPIRMEEQIFTAKVILKTGGKKVSPYLSAGLGGYQFTYRQNIFGMVPGLTETKEQAMPISYRETAFGMNVGGGLDIYMNDFLSIKFEGCYHKIYYDLVDQKLNFSVGFGFMF